MNENNDKHTRWFGVGKQIVSFLVGVIVASFVVGSARQRMSDLAAWKVETAPKIERMDSQGTLSFKHFHEEYLRTQEKQERRLDRLEQQMRDGRHE